MTFKESVSSCFSNFTDINGRAPRSEFWWFFLAWIIIQMILRTIQFLLLNTPGYGGMVQFSSVIFEIAYYAMYLPLFSVTIRRLHDMNMSGYWFFLWLLPLICNWILDNMMLIGLINIVCNITILILLIRRGTVGVNEYGDDPLQTVSDTNQVKE